MVEALAFVALLAVSLAGIAIGADTLRHIRKDSVPSLSRMSQRPVSRHAEPFGFWLTILAGLIWLMLGLFLLAVTLGGAFNLI